MTRKINMNTNDLYPEIEPYNKGHLKVSELHQVYYEESGNPDGVPVIFIHGGPGGGSSPGYRRFFDPKKWRVILFCQRGCGNSKPFSELRENTTWDLVSDMEKIRETLNIEKWALFGGSWGSTLSLAYAQTHPERVNALFLRGIFLLRHKELQWFYQEGASRIYPDVWEKYVAAIPESERNDFISAYHKRLTSDDAQIRQKAAIAWTTWEASTSFLLQRPDHIQSCSDDQFADAFARIECHYFINKGFFKSDGQLLENIDKISHIPCVIVQGRYDVVCPTESAWELHKSYPGSILEIIEDAGHSVKEVGITSKLIEYTDSWVDKLTK